MAVARCLSLTNVVLVDDNVLGAGGPVVVDGDDTHDGVSRLPLGDPAAHLVYHAREVLAHCQLRTQVGSLVSDQATAQLMSGHSIIDYTQRFSTNHISASNIERLGHINE